MTKLTLLEELAQSFLTTCVTLEAITNCDEHSDLVNTSESLANMSIGVHELDFNFWLDRSNLDIPIGTQVEGSRVVIKLCNYDHATVIYDNAETWAVTTSANFSPLEAEVRVTSMNIDGSLILDQTDQFDSMFIEGKD